MRSAAKKLMFRLSTHSSSEIAVEAGRWRRAAPALLTRMSRPPSVAIASLATFCAPSSVRVSPAMKVAPFGVSACVSGSDHDRRAAVDEALRGSRADAARPAGNKGAAAGELFGEIKKIFGHKVFHFQLRLRHSRHVGFRGIGLRREARAEGRSRPPDQSALARAS